MPTIGTSVTTIRQKVAEADADWAYKRSNAPTYEFSNGRKFERREAPGQAYPWTGTGT